MLDGAIVHEFPLNWCVKFLKNVLKFSDSFLFSRPMSVVWLMVKILSLIVFLLIFGSSKRTLQGDTPRTNRNSVFALVADNFLVSGPMTPMLYSQRSQ